MNEKDKFLKINNLRVEYESEGEVVHAVNGVSFSLEKGKTLGLVGETGAGKTTIAKAIMGILPEIQSKIPEGEICLEGHDLLKASEKEMLKVRGSKISMIFQDPMTALNPVHRVGNQIAEAVRLHSEGTKKDAEKRAREMLEMVGIPAERYKDYPHQFSGGMKQRVVIAMALACNPELLLADEPTTALDVTIQAQVLDMIQNLKKKLNTSMIMITHDMGIVAEVCDDVAVIYAGQIVEYGSKEQIFDNPRHPYTIGLFGAIPNFETDVDRLSPVEGMPPNPADLPKGCYFGPRCKYRKPDCENPIDMAELEKNHFCRCCNILRQEE